MKIYCIHNNSGSRYYRLIAQLKYLQELGHEVILQPNDDQNMTANTDWADLIILQMVFSNQLIKQLKQKKKKVIFECDDLLHIVPPTHYAHKETEGIKNRLKWWYKIYSHFSKVDGFISTNKHLDKKYGRFAKKSLIFDNYIDLTHWLKEYKPNTTDKIRLLWAGSTSHTGDLYLLKPVIKRVLEKYPQVEFIYVGMGGVRSDDLQAKFIYGEDFFNGLPDNRESLLPAPGKLWPYILASTHADLAVAPLEKNYFNKYKSQCKFLEYSINRIPAVYSRWFYTEAQDYALTADTPNEWYEHICRLIENKTLRQEISEEAFHYALNRKNITKHIEKWADFVLNV